MSTEPGDLAAFNQRVGRIVLGVALLVAVMIVFFVVRGGGDEDPTPNEICRDRVEASGLSVFTPEGEALERVCLDGFE